MSDFLISIIFRSGLFGIIQMKKALRNQNDLPIILMAPIEINPWIQFYDENIEKICSEITLLPNGSLVSMPSQPHILVLCIHNLQFICRLIRI